MNLLCRRSVLALAVLIVLPAATARAGDVQVSPFFGLQYGGGLDSVLGGTYLIAAGLEFGGTVDFGVGDSWGLEVLYSRQDSELERPGAPGFDMAVERYMAGVYEQKGEGRTRFIGVFLLGVTRLAPGFAGSGSDVRFTGGVGLGVKHLLSEHFGLRAEARAYYVVVEAGAGAVCAGSCLFVYSASGLWQGDVTAGMVIAF
jgi:hypothetical protein